MAQGKEVFLCHFYRKDSIHIIWKMFVYYYRNNIRKTLKSINVIPSKLCINMRQGRHCIYYNVSYR